MLIDEKGLSGEHGLERMGVKCSYQTKKEARKKWSVIRMKRRRAADMWWCSGVSGYPNANDKKPVWPAGSPGVRVVRSNYYRYEDVKQLDTVYRVELPSMYVSEALRDEIPRWRPSCNVMIKCRTGGGKNYFFENCIIPWCIENGMKCLYVSNRVTLGRQEKNRLAKIFGVEKKLDLYTDAGLDILKEFGCVTAISYQQLENFYNREEAELNRLLRQKFGFVVVDEPHYFLDDAAFNPLTDTSLHIITQHFRDAIKVYMSATPEQIFPVLRMYTPTSAENLWGRNTGPEVYDWLLYEFDEDYSTGLEAFAFKDLGDLCDIVKRSDEKWIIFVDSIQQGKIMKEILEEGVLITAASKDGNGADNDEYRNIVENESFDSRVLLTTKVLENGVNIRDFGIKNIALFCNDRTVFLQELGRVRRMSPSAPLKVYMHSPDQEQILAVYRSTVAMKQAVSLYSSSPTEFYRRYIANPSPIVNMKNAMIIMENGKAHINGLLFTKLEKHEIPFWHSIFERIQQGDIHALIREKFSWIGKDFSDDVWRGCQELIDARKDLAEFLEGWKGKVISGDDKMVFRVGFSEKFKRVYGSRKEDKSESQVYGLDIMKKRLDEKEELGYVLENGKKGWVLRKFQETKEDYQAGESEVTRADVE